MTQSVMQMLAGLPAVLVELPPMIGLLLRITLVLCLGWAAHFALARDNPRWRVFLWRAVAAGVLLMPLLMLVMPAMELAVAQTKIQAAPNPTGDSHAATPPNETPPNEAMPGFVPSQNALLPVTSPGALPAMPPVKQPILRVALITAENHPLLLLSIIWALVSLLLALKLLLSLRQVKRLLLQSESLVATNSHITNSHETARATARELLDDTLRQMGIARAVELRASSEISSPFLYGVRRPVIILPERMLESDYAAELPAIFVHELAHLRGRDLAWMTLIHLMSIALWFHPLAWRMRGAHASACEAVCDTVAARHIGSPLAYSRTLARIALELVALPPAVGGIAMARMPEVRRRLEALKRKIYDSPLARRWVAAALIVGLAAVSAIAGVRLTSPTLAWGKEVNGLRAALELVPSQKEYYIGQKVKVRFHVQNVGSQTALLAYSEGAPYYPNVRDLANMQILSNVSFNGYLSTTLHTLKSRETVVLDGVGFSIGKAAMDYPPVVRIADAGKYFIDFVIQFRDPASYAAHQKQKPQIPYENWQGTLETGDVNFSVGSRFFSLSSSDQSNTPQSKETSTSPTVVTSSPSQRSNVTDLIQSLQGGDISAGKMQDVTLPGNVKAKTVIFSLKRLDSEKLPQIPSQKPLPLNEMPMKVEQDAQLWLIPSPDAPTPAADFIAQIPVPEMPPDYYRKTAYMGTGNGYAWYIYGPIWYQVMWQNKLQLRDGEDPITATLRGLSIKDEGSMTANSCEALLSDFGAQTIPYLDKALANKDPLRDRYIRAIAYSKEPEITKWLIRQADSQDQEVSTTARHYLIVLPRPEATDMYVKWLKEDAGKKDVLHLLDACKAVHAQGIGKLLPLVLSSPSNQKEYRTAFEMQRELAGKPIPPELLEAEKGIMGIGNVSRKAIDQNAIDVAIQTIVSSNDEDAAAMIGACLAPGGGKIMNNDVIQSAGMRILKELPNGKGPALAELLAKRNEDFVPIANQLARKDSAEADPQLPASPPPTPAPEQSDPQTTPTAQSAEETPTSPTLVWGKEVNGLCAALELIPSQKEYHIGQTLKVRFHIQNVGNKAILLANAEGRPDDTPTVRDANGKEFPVRHITYWFFVKSALKTLKPGENVVLDGIGLRIGETWQSYGEAADQSHELVGSIINVPPGQYLIQYNLLFSFPGSGTYATDLKVPIPHENWQGTLETGDLGFAISETETSSSLSNIPWGQAVEGLQLRLRADKEVWAAGEVPKLQVDVQNIGKKTWSFFGNGREYDWQIDGKEYLWNGFLDITGEPFVPGSKYMGTEASLDSSYREREGNKRLSFSAGRHTIRAVLRPNGQSPDALRVFSNPIEIEVQSASSTLPVNSPANNAADTSRTLAGQAPGARGESANQTSSSLNTSSEDASWGKAVKGLQVSIEPQKKSYELDEPILMHWSIKNMGDKAQTILWHQEQQYLPVAFCYGKKGEKQTIHENIGAAIFDHVPAPPEKIVLESGQVREAVLDLRNFSMGHSEKDNKNLGMYQVAGLYTLKNTSSLFKSYLTQPEYKDVFADTIGSGDVAIELTDGLSWLKAQLSSGDVYARIKAARRLAPLISKDWVLTELKKFGTPKNPQQLVHLVDCMAELGDQSRVDEVVTLYETGEFPPSSDGGDVMLLFLLRWGGERGVRDLYAFLKESVNAQEGTSVYWNRRRLMEGLVNGDGWVLCESINVPKEAAPLLVFLLDEKQVHQKVNVTPKGSPGPEVYAEMRWCDDAGLALQEMMKRDWGLRKDLPEAKRDEILARMKNDLKSMAPTKSGKASAVETTGIFLTSNLPNAINVPTLGVFREPEAKSWRVAPEAAVPISSFRFARSGEPCDQAGDGKIEHTYEKDNKGYWTHLYIRPEASQHLADALAKQGAKAVLVMDGKGKGRLEPIDPREGHWGVANIKHGGPGLALAVQINAQIMAAWNAAGSVPPDGDPARKEVENSIRDSIKRGIRFSASWGPFQQEISRDLFMRTGKIGVKLYADLVDSGEIETTIRDSHLSLDLAQIARSLSINIPVDFQAELLRTIKNPAFRRAMAPGFAAYVRRDIGLGRASASQAAESFLEDSDPVVVCCLTAVASPESIRKHRSSVVEKLNSCLSSGEIPIESYLFNEMLDRVVKTQLTECSDSLSKYLIRSPKENLAMGIRALGDLNAFQAIQGIVLAHPEMSEGDLQLCFGALKPKPGVEAPPDFDQRAEALISLSNAALEGRWAAGDASRKALVYEMLTFSRLGGMGGPSEDLRRKTGYHALRTALHSWVGKPGGEKVLEALANGAPEPSEIPLFIEGLRSAERLDASACIRALSQLKARDAIPALVAVLDRPDALADLHPEYHKMTEQEMAKLQVGYAPADRDNLAYQTDAALAMLVDNNPSPALSVPPYTSEEILKQRREFWKKRVESGKDKSPSAGKM